MKKLTLILSLFALTFGLVGALFNTFALFSRQKQIPTQAINYRADSLTVEKLAKALRYETITGKDSFSLQEFNRFQTFLIENFPTVHSSKAITYIPIGANGRLYRWKGVDFNPKANLWLAAQDVAEPNLAFIPQWRFNPFVGKHEKGIIYGAGANKHKFCLLATLQAWENELKKGFAPKNDLYLFAPADFYSPISTQSKALTAIFYTQDLRFKYVLIAENYIATANNTFTDKNIAWIGTNQKNMLHLRLKSTDSTQIKSFEACLHAQTNTFNLKNVYNRQLLEFLSPELSFGTRFLFANEFLCAYFINNKLLKDSFLSKANRIEYIINRNDTVQTENRTAQIAELILLKNADIINKINPNNGDEDEKNTAASLKRVKLALPFVRQLRLAGLAGMEMHSENSFGRGTASFLGGFMLEMDINRYFALSFGLQYARRNHELELNSQEISPEGLIFNKKELRNTHLSLVQIPLLLQTNLFRNQKWRVYLNSGINANLILDKTYSGTLQINSSQTAGNMRMQTNLNPREYEAGLFQTGNFKQNAFLTAQIGVGAERQLSDHFSLFVQPTYQFSLTRFGTNQRDKTRVVSLNVGLKTNF